MAIQKYDIRRPASEGGGFEERYWSRVNAPVFGSDGRILLIVHRVEDVTELTHTTRALADEGETMRLEVMLRGQELQEANRRLQEATEQFQAMYETVVEILAHLPSGYRFAHANIGGRDDADIDLDRLASADTQDLPFL